MFKYLVCLLLLPIFFELGSCRLHFDNNQITKIQSIIDEESREIAEAQTHDPCALSKLHLSRGESYLFFDQPERALEDFFVAYQLSSTIEEERTKAISLFRALFGSVIAYCNLDQETEALALTNELMSIIEQIQCDGCKEHQLLTELINYTNSSNPEINEPNENMLGWCEEVVRGTADSMRFLASMAKTITARLALFGTISALETRCLKCCASGEFWRTCVSPIAEKWKEWNDKYTLFRIPPDPAWD